MIHAVRLPKAHPEQMTACRRSSALRGCYGQSHSGSLLLEALLSIALVALFLTGIGASLLLGEQATQAGGNRGRATFLAEQHLEAVRQMAYDDFSTIEPGTHGIVLTSEGWTLTGTQVTVGDYNANIAILAKETDAFEVTSNVSWQLDGVRTGSLSLTTYMTNWHAIASTGDWSQLSSAGSVTDTDTPNFRRVAVSGNYAFISSLHANETYPDRTGKGLYVFDVSNPASPIRTASSFDLGSSAEGLAINDNRLFIATDDPAKQVQIFDISDPENLDGADLLGSFTLPTGLRALSIGVYGNTVYVGTQESVAEDNFYAISVSSTGAMALLSSIDASGSILDMSLQDGYAYIGTSYNPGELQVVDIFDPEHLIFAPGTGIDMDGVEDGLSVALSGTSALVGRMAGSISELTLYTIADSPVPDPPPSWTLESSGDINDIAVVPGSAYAFLGGSTDNAEIRVIDLNAMASNDPLRPPLLTSYDTDSAGSVQGLWYDWLQDLLFAVTDNTFLILAPQ